ncbi:FtsK/SpoIIIE domain-containing protein, partial [Streptomyces oceani]|uniref:FtsK/SpoIIIE domain-containing protein n=1 Tax=Streptomyces oceani TaxID=1075402 RepID=UPI0023B94956
RFARALAPLREAEGAAGTPRSRRAASALPRGCRLLEELGLARATPAAVLNRWDTTARGGAPAGDGAPVPPVVARLVPGIGPHGTVETDLAALGTHAFLTGPTGSGRTELLRALAASLAAGERPDRLGLVLIDGGGAVRDGGLQATAELPHVKSSLSTGDPVLMREFAQSLSAELKRRAELLGDLTYEQHLREFGPEHHRVVAPRAPAERQSSRGTATAEAAATGPGSPKSPESPGSPEFGGHRKHGPLPRLVVLVDDFDRLVDPALGDPGRPASGSIVRALESVASGGVSVGVHLIATSSRPERTAQSRTDHEAGIRIELTGVDGEDAAPGRGSVLFPDGSRVPFQAGRVTGRIPRTSTVRPTVVPLDWARAGDPPARRPVRELGNGPTDLALLASAMTRAARSLGAPRGELGGSGAAPPEETSDRATAGREGPSGGDASSDMRRRRAGARGES